jgi:site-specific recombinase XerD
LLDAPAPNTRDGIRDRAMFYLAYSAGLRNVSTTLIHPGSKFRLGS